MVLTDRQRALLRRIAAGDDLSGPDGVSERTSARALASRHLVKVSRKNGRWSAQVTADGEQFLLHGGPPGEPAKGTSLAAVRKKAAVRAGAVAATDSDPLVLARDLLGRLEAAPDRVVWLTAPDDSTRAAYRRAIHAAKKHNLVPAGFSLQHSGRDHGDIAVRLSDNANPDETGWNRIRAKVRDEITSLAEILQVLSRGGEVIRTKDEDLRPAALEVVRVFVETARAAGHHVVLSRLKLKFTPEGGQPREVYVWQEYDKVAHVATPEELRRARRQWAFKVPEFDSVPASRFELFMNYGYNQRDRWTAIPVTGPTRRIRQILDEANESERVARLEREARQREYEAQQESYRRKKEEEEAHWNEAMTEAKRQAVLHLRAETFQSAFDAWLRARDMRAFCAELHANGTHNPDNAHNLAQWIEWGLATADDIDPTVAPTTLAATSFDIQPGPDDLRPYLGSWSPHGPYIEYRSDRRQPAEPSDSHHNDWHHGRRGRPNWWRQ